MAETLSKLSLESYIGSEAVKKVKAEAVIRSWNLSREAVSLQPPIVVVSRPGTSTMSLGENSYFVPTKTFGDGASTIDYDVLIESVEQQQLAGKGAIVIANLQTEKDVLNIKGLGRVLRMLGAERVLLVASRLYGLRQDDVFTDYKTGKPVAKTTTSVDVLDSLAATNRPDPRRLFDRLIINESHSSGIFQQAWILGLPTIGLSAYRWMLEKSGLRQEVDETWGVLGPDKGRHTTAHLLARELGLKVFSFKKERDRTSDKLQLVDVDKTIQALREAEIEEGIMFDDELQSGSTTNIIAERSGLKRITVLATQANFSEETNGNLSHPAIKRVIVTNAMNPGFPIEKLKSGAKFEVLDIWPSLIQTAQQLWAEPLDSRLPDGWVLDPWFT